MAYDNKFKERALTYWAEGHSHRETAKIFGIGTTTLKKWKKLKAEGKELSPKPRIYKAKKLPAERLKEYVLERPDAYLSEIAEHFGCTGEGVRQALRRNGIVRKKNRKIPRT